MHRCCIDRLPGGVALRGGITVDVAVTYCRNRTPELVFVLGVEDSDHSVRRRERKERHKACAVQQVHVLCDDNLPGQLIVGEGPTD